jgi:hypothetical protein
MEGSSFVMIATTGGDVRSQEIEGLKQALSLFRQDVIQAFCELDAEIDALFQALEEGTVVSPQRLRQIRLDSAIKMDRFSKHHSRYIASLDDSEH